MGGSFSHSHTRIVIGLYLVSWYIAACVFGVMYAGGAFVSKMADTPVAQVVVSDQAKNQGSVVTDQGKDSENTRMMSAVLGVVLFGALGSVVTATIEFTKTSHMSRTASWYYLSPFMGMFLAGFFFIGIRAGLLTLAGAESQKDQITNMNFYFFVAVVSGLFSETAYRKLEDVANTLFSLSNGSAAEMARQQPVQAQRMNSYEMVVADHGKLQEIFRLRYESLVSFKGIDVLGADHEAKILTDDLDAVSINFASYRGDRPLASLRNTAYSQPVFMLHSGCTLTSLFRRLELPLPPAELMLKSSSTSRLAVTADDEFSTAQKWRLIEKLAVYTYCFSIKTATCVDWITVADKHLSRVFQKYGYRVLATEIYNAETKQDVELLYLLLRDFAYLRDKNSIFIECMHEDVQQDDQLDQLKALIGDYGKALQQAGYQVP
ncbi:MAG: hypothetical protein JMN27_00870 [gamma proteobacterium endosymbiont of Lamellibrachia anaximandri]|nr:hypothetical protein [gamma proteobacterium endosymbiont of Lamellibrachia anaximandri]MBL3532367.1 hypothetical protein [gamma proteobacterium endosymbiont of Lamellibrachia anaximandri]MBL3598545.1 hypothetical protein [gamma proteobacterium endosymbiont of Lamellibrachia anaximandri]